MSCSSRPYQRGCASSLKDAAGFQAFWSLSSPWVRSLDLLSEPPGKPQEGYLFLPKMIGGSDCKESACNAGDGFDPWVGKIPWRRERLPTPIFLLGELYGERSLAGYSSWGLKEWDMTERLTHIQNLCSFMRNTISSAKCFISFLHLSCGNPHFFQATQSWGSCLTSCAS